MSDDAPQGPPPAILARRALRERTAAALRSGWIAAIDAGQAETVCAVAKVDVARVTRGADDRASDAYGALRVAGVAAVPSSGMRGGLVAEPDLAALAMREAFDAAKAQAGGGASGLDGAVLTLNGGLPRTLRASAETSIPTATVDDATVARLMAACRPELAPRLRRPLVVEPAFFAIEDGPPVRDPRGVAARSLSMTLAALTVEKASLEALVRAASLAGIGVDGVAYAPVAAALSVLTDDELELGAVALEMGAAITGVASFSGGTFRRADAVPLGGERVTADLSEGLSVPRDEAEALKVRAGSPVSADPAILGGAAGGGQADAVTVGIVRPRVEETFELVRLRLEEAGVDPARPVVLSGGASRLPGTVEVARAVLDRRVRLGRPLRVAGGAAKGAGPQLSAVLGALVHAVRCERDPWTGAMKIVADEGRAFRGVIDWLRRNW